MMTTTTSKSSRSVWADLIKLSEYTSVPVASKEGIGSVSISNLAITGHVSVYQVIVAGKKERKQI